MIGRRRIVTVVLAVGLVAAGCGGSDGLVCPGRLPPEPRVVETPSYSPRPSLEDELLSTFVMVVLPNDGHGVVLVEVPDYEAGLENCAYEIDLTTVDEVEVIVRALPSDLVRFHRTTRYFDPLEKVVESESRMVLLLGGLDNWITGHLLVIDQDGRLLPGDLAGDEGRFSIDRQIEVFGKARERLGLDIGDALAAYGRAGLACLQGLDAWTVEPEGARIALAVRRAVGASLAPRPLHWDDTGIEDLEGIWEDRPCDLRCAVRGEVDPCRDW